MKLLCNVNQWPTVYQNEAYYKHYEKEKGWLIPNCPGTHILDDEGIQRRLLVQRLAIFIHPNLYRFLN
jgi:hypothetical protein